MPKTRFNIGEQEIWQCTAWKEWKRSTERMKKAVRGKTCNIEHTILAKASIRWLWFSSDPNNLHLEKKYQTSNFRRWMLEIMNFLIHPLGSQFEVFSGVSVGIQCHEVASFLHEFALLRVKMFGGDNNIIVHEDSTKNQSTFNNSLAFSMAYCNRVKAIEISPRWVTFRLNR